MADVKESEGLVIEVTEKLAGFKEGQILNEPGDVVSYLRTLYDTRSDAKTDLSDEQIMAVAVNVAQGEDQEEWLDTVMEAIETGNVPGEEREPEYEIAKDIQDVAEKIAKDKAIQQWIDDVITGQAKVDSGPVHIFERFKADLSPKERAIIPWPGSTAKESNNPDVYEGPRKQKANGEWHSPKLYKVKEIIGLQPRVVALDKAIDEITAPQGAKLSALQVGARKDLNAEKSSAVRAYTRAIKVMHIADKLEGHAHIGFAVKKNQSDGKTVTSKYCLNVWNKHLQLDGSSITVSAFINLKAITKDTTYTQLTAMMKRSGKKAPKVTIPDSLEAGAIDPVVAALVNALENNGIFSVIKGNIEAKGDESDHLLLTVARLEELCFDLLKTPGTRKRLAELRRKEQEEGNDAKSNAA